MTRKNIAVILSGGVGARMGMETPKQFLKVAGQSILEHTVSVFENHGRIDEIAIVAAPEDHDLVNDMVLTNEWGKVKKILTGGAERYESTKSAIEAYRADSSTNLIIHDSVRPLLSQTTLTDVIDALDTYKAVDTVIPASDTIVQVSKGYPNLIAAIPDRDLLRLGQTPQGFHYEILAEAYEIGLSDPGFGVTDDCGVVKKYLPEVDIFTVTGSQTNMKLTYPSDLYLLEKLFQLRTTTGVENSEAPDLTGTVTVVFGGSSGIGQSAMELIQERGGIAVDYSRSTTGTNIANRESVADALAETARLHGRIDYVICSAAILRKEPLVSMEQEALAELIDVNLVGAINVSIESYKYLKETRGHLVHFTSSSYTRGRPFYSVYSATKAAIVNFVQALSEEWRPQRIRVNCINPERTRTQMRVTNFGIEPPHTLLEPEVVARETVNLLPEPRTGEVIDIKLAGTAK